MPSNRGAGESAPFSQRIDPRVHELNIALQQLETGFSSWARSGGTADTFRIRQEFNLDTGNSDFQVILGVVIHPITGLGWYKVQAGSGFGFLPCCSLSQTSNLPLGSRDIGAYAPNTQVLIWKPQGQKYGYILFAMPPLVTDGRIVNPDFLFQTGQSGLLREGLHQFPIKYLNNSGDIDDFGGNKPIDATTQDKGFISSTGIALFVNDFEFQVRVNELCGIFGSLFDSWMGVFGRNLDIVSDGYEDIFRHDEGEFYHFRGESVYPWEALGLSAVNKYPYQVNEDVTVQYDKPLAKIDLTEANQKITGAHRRIRYGGYLGQGGRKFVVVPQFDPDGIKRKEGTVSDIGVFSQSVSLDGEFVQSSLRGNHFIKTCKIPVPKQLYAPEEIKGDDARGANYRFSSKFGNTPEHKLTEHDPKAETIEDYLNYTENWRANHPFDYHKKDFYLESPTQANPDAATSQTVLDFSVILADLPFNYPDPKTLKIDHRASSQYYETKAYFGQLPNGDFLAFNGMGTRIALVGDKLYLDAPGGVYINGGKEVVTTSNQIITKGYSAVDVSVTNGSYRVKAETNMQFLAGNSGTGVMLFENRAAGKVLDFEGLVGDEITGSGIVFKAQDTFISSYAQTAYHRTSTGDYTIDAGKGSANINLKAQDMLTFLSNKLALNFGTNLNSDTVDNTHEITSESVFLNARLKVGGRVTVFDGAGGQPSIYVGGEIRATGNIGSAGRISDSQGSGMAKVSSSFGNDLSDQLLSLTSDASVLVKTAQLEHDTLSEGIYATNGVGNEDFLSLMGFSFRDTRDQSQYRTSNLSLILPRWQQMVETGQARGGLAWEEKPVSYQGADLLPWPGLKAWSQTEVVSLQKDLAFTKSDGNATDLDEMESRILETTTATLSSTARML